MGESTRFYTERMFRIIDDPTEIVVEIGPDGDGLDLVSISCEEEGKRIASFMICPEHARLVGQALIQMADDMEDTE